MVSILVVVLVVVSAAVVVVLVVVAVVLVGFAGRCARIAPWRWVAVSFDIGDK